MKGLYDKSHALTMTVEDFAKEIGISVYTARSMVKRGEIRSIKLGKLRRIPRLVLTELLEANDGKSTGSG